ncbi:peptidase M20 domain-containing protein 2-like [Aplysia californica]|uniref:Peptidase M20 domain-containing protein 2 n=1 Tax=Aplysia californica TaxID=6500 RepID=A0ABM0ZUR5_APLCA|nr:peptidase M20 domain-containing protein 2-like [Aplysia californica]
MEALFETACRKIDEEAEELRSLSHLIWSNPELNFEEKDSHNVITDFLEKRGFRVQRNYVLETAFSAEWVNCGKLSWELPHIMVLCEYDALPEIGHACGHNLITELGVAAGMGVKAAMEENQGLVGKLTILGTPAEEGGGGKAYLIEAGAFKGVHAALMAHPAPFNIDDPTTLAVKFVEVTYHGKAAHSSVSPWQGINALDAAVHAYTGISHLRQQIRPSGRVHGIITKGGTKSNIVPDLCKMEYTIREDTLANLDLLCDKVVGCLQAAALATGCTVEVEWEAKPYADMRNNETLVSVYQRHIERLEPGRQAHKGEKEAFKGSTDMGNVSHEVPSIHPFYYVGNELNHTNEFTALAGSEGAQLFTLNQGKAMSMTCIEMMMDKTLLQRAASDFQSTKARQD